MIPARDSAGSEPLSQGWAPGTQAGPRGWGPRGHCRLWKGAAHAPPLNLKISPGDGVPRASPRLAEGAACSHPLYYTYKSRVIGSVGAYGPQGGCTPPHINNPALGDGDPGVSKRLGEEGPGAPPPTKKKFPAPRDPCPPLVAFF